jgi:hypothetical protein
MSCSEIGFGVDAVSGAMNKYADQVTVAMIADQASQRGETPPIASQRTPLR